MISYRQPAATGPAARSAAGRAGPAARRSPVGSSRRDRSHAQRSLRPGRLLRPGGRGPRAGAGLDRLGLPRPRPRLRHRGPGLQGPPRLPRGQHHQPGHPHPRLADQVRLHRRPDRRPGHPPRHADGHRGGPGHLEVRRLQALGPDPGDRPPGLHRGRPEPHLLHPRRRDPHPRRGRLRRRLPGVQAARDPDAELRRRDARLGRHEDAGRSARTSRRSSSSSAARGAPPGTRSPRR